ATRKLGLGGLERAQPLLPFALEAASDQAVVGIDGAVAALGAARFVACPLDAEAPLSERGLAIGLEPLRGGDRGGKPCRLEGGDERPRDGLVDLDAADAEAIDAAALGSCRGNDSLARSGVRDSWCASGVRSVRRRPSLAAERSLPSRRRPLCAVRGGYSGRCNPGWPHRSANRGSPDDGRE